MDSKRHGLLDDQREKAILVEHQDHVKQTAIFEDSFIAWEATLPIGFGYTGRGCRAGVIGYSSAA
jgi:hypothetical protein